MESRKEMKKKAKVNLKKHYILFVFLCILMAFVGSEFQESLEVFRGAETTKQTGSEDLKSVGGRITMSDVITNALDGNEKQSEKDSQNIIKEDQKKTKKDSMFGRRRGVLASAVNAVSSGSIFVTVFAAVMSLSKSKSVALFIFVILALAFTIFLWFYVQNMLKVVVRRLFLEGRIYDEIVISRITFFFRIKCWTKIAWVMFVEFVYSSLWMLTIVGGIIKIYSYKMVPFIVAENPKIKANEAITLSRNMMNGHKWECFILDMSFIGWNLLGMITFGLSDIFFLNAYTIAVYSEYYANLRKLSFINKVKNTNLLNDKYLYEKAPEELLAFTYSDMEQLMKEPEIKVEEKKGISKFFENIFGIVLYNSSTEKQFEKNQMRKAMTHDYQEILEQKRYPERLFEVRVKEKVMKESSFHYLRHYSVWSVIVMFFVFSFVGWMWEVSLHLILDGAFVNRGVLHGPWLPIYGAGGVLILVLLNKFRNNPPMEFVAAVLTSGTIEYCTSYFLQVTHHGKKWWDYSGYFLNLNGRVCAEGLLVFGLGGVLIVYLVAPGLDNWIRKIKFKVLVPICLSLIVLFGVDQVYSSKHPNEGKGITDYK